MQYIKCGFLSKFQRTLQCTVLLADKVQQSFLLEHSLMHTASMFLYLM